MFLKFTRLDGSPIWINATFVVTVEPRRGSGSIIVPIGDGLDYDVREDPETVLAMLEGKPSATTVPQLPPKQAAVVIEPAAAPLAEEGAPLAVPPPRSLPEKFTDVVGDGLSAPQEHEIDTRPAVTISVSPEPVAEEPAKKPRAKRRTKAEAASASGETAGAKPAKKTTRARKAKKAVLTLDESQVERLRRMAPGSIRKLHNTLVTQFRVTEVEAEVQALMEKGVLRLENDHVVW